MEVECIAHGNPIPTVVWHKGNTPINQPSKKYQRLHLKSVGLFDAGQYVCIASNIVGRVERFITFEVLGTRITFHNLNSYVDK